VQENRTAGSRAILHEIGCELHTVGAGQISRVYRWP